MVITTQDKMVFSNRHLTAWLVTIQAAFASVTLDDPSDVIPPSDWAADNAIVPDYDITFIDVQPIPSMAVTFL